jgi:hypothetical protein
MGRGPESEGGTWYGAQGGKCVVIDSGPAVAFNQLRNAGFSPKTVEYRDNDSALTKVDVVYNVALTWKKDESEVDCLAAVPAHEEHPSDVQVASPGDQGAADGAPWQWGDDVASPAGGEWYFAEPDLGTCQHMSTKVVQMAEAYWKERGQYPLRDVAKSGFASIVIPQGGNKMLTAFASEADCWRSIGK